MITTTETSIFLQTTKCHCIGIRPLTCYTSCVTTSCNFLRIFLTVKYSGSPSSPKNKTMSNLITQAWNTNKSWALVLEWPQLTTRRSTPRPMDWDQTWIDSTKDRMIRDWWLRAGANHRPPVRIYLSQPRRTGWVQWATWVATRCLIWSPISEDSITCNS